MENDAQARKFTVMTTAPIGRLVMKLALPTVVSMLVTSFYNMADTYFVGTLGKSATGGVSVIFSFMAIIQAVGFFFGHGSGNYISRELGKKNYEDANRMAATGFFSALIIGVVILVLGMLLRRPLCYVLGSTETILPYAMDYLFWILLATPLMTSQLVLNNQLRFQGNAAYAMVGITVGAVLNCLLDPLFILVFKWGIAGAGAATALSQAVSFVLLFLGTRRGDTIKIHLRSFSPQWRYFRQILNGGSPSLARQGFAALSTIVFNFACHPFGDAAIAGFGIATKILHFAGSAMIGFGQGFQPVCGFNYGAGKYRRVRQAFYFAVWVAFSAMIVIAIGGILVATPLTALFTSDVSTAEIAAKALRYQLATLPLSCWVVLANMMYQTIGKALPANFLAMSRQGLFMIPAALLLPIAWGLTGLYWAQPASDILAALCAVPMALHQLKAFKKEELSHA